VLICRYQRCGACLSLYSAFHSRRTVTSSSPLFGPCFGQPSGSSMYSASLSTAGLSKAVTTSRWTIVQLFCVARLIRNRKVECLPMGAYVSL